MEKKFTAENLKRFGKSLFDKVKEAIADAVKDKADKTAIPTRTSQLTNNSGFIKTTALPLIVMQNDGGHTLEPDYMYIWGEALELSITIPNVLDEFSVPPYDYDRSVAHEFCFEFISRSQPTNLQLPSFVTFPDGLEIKANMRYQISIMDNIGLICGVPTT